MPGKPELLPELRPYWNAFAELNAQRAPGFAAATPLADIRALLELRDVRREEWPRWLDVILVLDGIWLAELRAAAEADKDKGRETPAPSKD